MHYFEKDLARGEAEERNVAVLLFKPIRKLPDPNKDLSIIIPPSAIREANKAMAVETTECMLSSSLRHSNLTALLWWPPRDPCITTHVASLKYYMCIRT